MAMGWDNSDLSKSENWPRFQNMHDFIHQFDFNFKNWRPIADEVGLGYSDGGDDGQSDDFTAGMLALVGLEEYPEAIGAIHNRGWNYFTIGEATSLVYDSLGNIIDTLSFDCGNPDDLALDDIVAAQLAVPTTIDTNHENGPYPLYLVNIAEENILYEITYINPFTGDTTEVETQLCQYAATEFEPNDYRWRIPLDYPPLGIYGNDSPVYIFHAKPIITKSATHQTESSFSPVDIQVYPNPVSDMISIIINGMEESNELCRIHSSTGNIIKECRVSNGLNRLQLNELSSGVYYIHIYSNLQGNLNYKKRIIVVK